MKIRLIIQLSLIEAIINNDDYDDLSISTTKLLLILDLTMMISIHKVDHVLFLSQYLMHFVNKLSRLLIPDIQSLL